MQNSEGYVIFAQVNEWMTVAGAKATAIFAVVLSTIMSLFALPPRLGRYAPPTPLIRFNHVVRRFANDRKGFVLAFTAAADDPVVIRGLTYET